MNSMSPPRIKTTSPRLAALALTFGAKPAGRSFEPGGKIRWEFTGLSEDALLERQVDDTPEMRLLRAFYGNLESIYDQFAQLRERRR